MNGMTDLSTSNAHHYPATPARQFTIHEYLAILYRGRWLILATFVFTLAAASFVTISKPTFYDAKTTILIDNKVGVTEALFDLDGIISQKTWIKNQVEILKSRALAQAVIEHLLTVPERDSLQLIRGIGTTRTALDATQKLQTLVIITPVRDTDLIEIQVTGPTPFEAAFLANSFAQTYVDLDREFSRRETSEAVEFIERQLIKKEKDLQRSEDDLKDFLQHESVAVGSGEASQFAQQFSEFESSHKQTLVEIEVKEKHLLALKNQLGESKARLESEIAKVTSPLIMELRQQVAEIQRTIAVYLAQDVSEDDPLVLQERKKLAGLESRLSKEIKKLIAAGLPANDPLSHAQELVAQILQFEVEISVMKMRSEALERVLQEYVKKLEALPEKNVQLARLKRNHQLDETLYMMMREKYEESRITQAGQIGRVRVIDTALPPEIPASPETNINFLLFGIVGLGLGIFITFMRERFDTSLRGLEDVEAMGLPTLGAIPAIETATTNGHHNGTNGHASVGPDIVRRLITHYAPQSTASEAYRTLRTTVQSVANAEELRTILVTSAGPYEGKSTTAANLAITMCQKGLRTVLIDSDLRRPVVHRSFHVERHVGLSNFLSGKSELLEIIRKSEVQNLNVIASGPLPPNPAELLSSDRMNELLERLREDYDLCILDSPPLMAVTDAAVLAREVDGVILVVRSGQTRHAAFTRGIELLENVKANVLGVVVNDVRWGNTYGSYYYYHYYGENNGKSKKSNRSIFMADSTK